jgi:hypothetical protein
MSTVVVLARKRVALLSFLCAAGALLTIAGTASAGPVSDQFGAASTITIAIPNVDPSVLNIVPSPAPPTSIARDGSGAITNLGMPADIFAVSNFIVPVTDPGVFPIAGLQVTASNDAGAFNANGNLGGVMPLKGGNKVCLYGACGSSTNISNLAVPLNVVGNTAPNNVTTVQGAVNLTVIGAPWTTGTAAIGTLTATGGSVANTAAGSNMVTLVTPVFVSTNIGAFAVVPVFGTMNLVIESPEPGAVAAFGTAIAGLLAMGLARRRKG